jgi:hypothetical protein
LPVLKGFKPKLRASKMVENASGRLTMQNSFSVFRVGAAEQMNNEAGNEQNHQGYTQ